MQRRTLPDFVDHFPLLFTELDKCLLKNNRLFYQGSNESLLSDPGDEHYSSVPVTGELFVSLRYEMPSKKFEIHVHSANNLACADAKKSSSDP